MSSGVTKKFIASHLAVAPLIVYLCILTANVGAFRCYVCDSKSNIECTEKLPSNSRLTLKDCGNLTEAKYCIKTTNIFAGELGTKRFCASNDQGSYCKYIKQPTGDRYYRSCVLTCNSEGCNGSKALLDGGAILYITVPATIIASLITTFLFAPG